MTSCSWRVRRVALLCTGVTFVACASPEAGVHVHASLDGVALAGLEVQALPFDAERLLDSLAAHAPAPAPDYAALAAELLAFVPPDERVFDQAGASWRVLRDSVRALADSLHVMDRRTREYAALYERFRGIYGRLAERTADRDRALRELTREDRRLAGRASAAAESLRVWEREAYAAFDGLAEAAVLASGRAPKAGRTSAEGRLHLELEPGAWWLVARYPDPRNPFRELSWAQPVVVTSWLPVYLPMAAVNARAGWRH